mmetsp:Transcript_39428/g.96999  ORF Transcript_39428/g.96999 Transcript_39428/m.96999 type:complete len:207 (-) Transcript_39428:706-1326(-)
MSSGSCLGWLRAASSTTTTSMRAARSPRGLSARSSRPPFKGRKWPSSGSSRTRAARRVSLSACVRCSWRSVCYRRFTTPTWSSSSVLLRIFPLPRPLRRACFWVWCSSCARRAICTSAYTRTRVLGSLRTPKSASQRTLPRACRTCTLSTLCTVTSRTVTCLYQATTRSRSPTLGVRARSTGSRTARAPSQGAPLSWPPSSLAGRC